MNRKASAQRKDTDRLGRATVLFQHFLPISRNQDHEGNNTPASDDRGGRNFHFPNICMSRDVLLRLSAMCAIASSHRTSFFSLCYTPVVLHSISTG